MSRQSRTQQEQSQSKWGQAAEAAQRGDQVSWRNDDRFNDSEWIEEETKRTQQESLQSSRRAMQRLNDTQTIAEQNLNMLNSQSEQFYKMEKKLDEASASAKTQETKLDYLKSLNKYFFLPSFGGKKAKKAEQVLNQKKETDNYGDKKHIKEREKQWEQRNKRVNQSNLENINQNKIYHTTPNDLDQDETESEINENMNNISSGLSRLKMMGMAMSLELDSQSGQMDRIAKRSEKTITNVSKLNNKDQDQDQDQDQALEHLSKHMKSQVIASAEKRTQSTEAINANLLSISRARAMLALVSGTAAGILGLESLYGFSFYFACSLLLSITLFVIKAGMNPGKYLPFHDMIWTFGVFGNLSSYVLFWVLAFGVDPNFRYVEPVLLQKTLKEPFHEEKTVQGIQLETWKALLAVTNKLDRVKTKHSKVIDSSSKSYSPIVKNARNTYPISSITPTNGTGNSFNELPAELIYSIIQYITDQETLFNLLCSNRRMKNIILPILYINPYLTSPKSIISFLNTLSKNSWKPASISFGPTCTNNLSTLRTSKTQIFEFLPYVYSGLFNHLIHDRDNLNSTSQLVHPIFYKFATLSQDETIFEEYGYHKENSSRKPAIREPFLTKNNLQLSQIPSSSMTLQNLFATCRKWDQGFDEWGDLKSSLADCLSTCLLLMEWLQGDFYPIWHLLGGQVVREVKPLILRQCRELLSHIYQSLLLQVRFITANSQRLLDCYCLIYYKVLSVAQILDVQGLFDAIGYSPPISEACPSVSNEIKDILKIPQVRMESDDPDLIASLPPSIPDWNTAKEKITLGDVNSKTSNQIIARKIYDSLIMIFQFRIPSKLQNTSGMPLVPVSILRDILVTFPPSSVNKETVEFIQPLTEVQLIQGDTSTPVLLRWLKWLKEIIIWNEASVEMEPVKDLLRKSMDKIDQLRTIQHRYGLMFMD